MTSDGKYEGCQTIPLLPLLYRHPGIAAPQCGNEEDTHANYHPRCCWDCRHNGAAHFAFSRHKSVVIIAALGGGDPRGIPGKAGASWGQTKFKS